MSEFDEKTSDFLSRLGIFHNHPAGKKLSKDFSTFSALKKSQPSLDDLLKLGFSNFEANLIRKKIQPKVQPKAEEKPQEKKQTNSSEKSQQKVETKSESKSEVNPQKKESKVEPQKVEQKSEVKSEDKSSSSQKTEAQTLKSEEKSQLKVDETKAQVNTQTEPKSEQAPNIASSKKPQTVDQKPTEETTSSQPTKVESKLHVEKPVTETASKLESKPVAQVEEKPPVQKIVEKPVKHVEVKVEEKPVVQTVPPKVEEKPPVQKIEEKPVKHIEVKVEEKPVIQPKVREEPIRIALKEEEKQTESSPVSQQVPQTSSDKSQIHFEDKAPSNIEESQLPSKSKEGPLQIKVIQEPETKIIEKSDRWIILAALPGSKSDKIEVVVKDDILSIRAPLISTETTKRVSLYEKKIRIPKYILNHPKLNENPLETTVQYDRGLLVIEIRKPEFIRSDQPKVTQNQTPFTLSSTPLSDNNRTSTHSVSVPIKNTNQVDMKKSNTSQKGNEDISAPKKIQNPKANPNTSKPQPKEEPIRRSKPNPNPYSRRTLDLDDFAKEIDSFFNDDFFSTRRMFGVPPVSSFPWFDTDPLHPPVFTRPFFRSNIPFSFF